MNVHLGTRGPQTHPLAHQLARPGLLCGVELGLPPANLRPGLPCGLTALAGSLVDAFALTFAQGTRNGCDDGEIRDPCPCAPLLFACHAAHCALERFLCCRHDMACGSELVFLLF